MCKCKDIEFGSYKRQVSMKDPFNSRKRNDGWVCVDVCICQEIAELWLLEIPTIESCCGHNKKDGYIMVNKKDKVKMIKLGYKKTDWKADNLICFYPKLTIC